MKTTKTNTLPKGMQNTLEKLDAVLADDYQPAETALDRVLFATSETTTDECTAQDTTDTAALKARIAELEAENAQLHKDIRTARHANKMQMKQAVDGYKYTLQKHLDMILKDSKILDEGEYTIQERYETACLLLEEMFDNLRRCGIQFNSEYCVA